MVKTDCCCNCFILHLHGVEPSCVPLRHRRTVVVDRCSAGEAARKRRPAAGHGLPWNILDGMAIPSSGTVPQTLNPKPQTPKP